MVTDERRSNGGRDIICRYNISRDERRAQIEEQIKTDPIAVVVSIPTFTNHQYRADFPLCVINRRLSGVRGLE